MQFFMVDNTNHVVMVGRMRKVKVFDRKTNPALGGTEMIFAFNAGFHEFISLSGSFGSQVVAVIEREDGTVLARELSLIQFDDERCKHFLA